MEAEYDQKLELPGEGEDQSTIPLLPLDSIRDFDEEEQLVDGVRSTVKPRHPSRQEDLRPIPGKRGITYLFIMLASSLLALTGLLALTRAAYLEKKAASSSSSVPDYFQTTPQIYAGNPSIPNVYRERRTMGLIDPKRPNQDRTSAIPGSNQPGSFRRVAFLCGQCASRDSSPNCGKFQQSEHLSAHGPIEPLLPKPKVCCPRAALMALFSG